MEDKEWAYFWLLMDQFVSQEAHKEAHVLANNTREGTKMIGWIILHWATCILLVKNEKLICINTIEISYSLKIK